MRSIVRYFLYEPPSCWGLEIIVLSRNFSPINFVYTPDACAYVWSPTVTPETMDHPLPDLPKAATRTKLADHGPVKSVLPAQEIFEGLSLLLTIEEILQLHRDLRCRSEEEVRSLAEQCHRTCRSSPRHALLLLTFASCRSFGFSTIVAVFSDIEILALVSSLKHVHSISRLGPYSTPHQQ